jgi:predicted secreted protein
MQSISCRRFLEGSMLAAAAAAAGVVLPVAAQEKKPGNANNRIRVAILGCRIRGKRHAQELAPLRDCEIAYVCDPDRGLAGELAAAVEKQQGTAPKTAQDMRRVFDDRAVDAVFVATPNHWHALAAIWAG